jgi:hypothetical protein
MRIRSAITAQKVTTAADRLQALRVIDQVYRREKRWIGSAAAEIPADPAAVHDRSWFIARVGGRAAGVIRLVYDPPLELPAACGMSLESGVDLARLQQGGRFVEVGRFMIRPRHRRNVRVVLSLMRAATLDAVERGYTHFLTDVFENDPHSPLGFHTRVLGFERIGTHQWGELSCSSRRVILVLDIAKAYQRIKQRQDRLWKEIGEGVRELMEGRRLATSA